MLQAYDKVQSVIDIVIGIRQVLSLVSNGDLDQALRSASPRTFPPRIDFSEAAGIFAEGSIEAINRGKSSWTSGYALDYARGKRLKAYILYLPVITSAAPTLKTTGRRINGVPLKVGIGAPGKKGGSLGGVGLEMGRERMLFRMDIGTTPAGHIVGKGSEIDAFDKPPFSFHVYDWRGGPR